MPWKRRRRSSRRPWRVAGLAAALAMLVLALHLPFLHLPFHWDEAGQFVPAALDLYRYGDLIPRSATPNVHPPGVMLYLAAVWKVFGFSIPATRIAMLLLAGTGVFLAFLLAVELCRATPGVPAFLAVVFLLASPIFYTQAMMAQLDMPAMVFTLLAFWLFLRDRCALAAAACAVLVIVKETGLLAPLVFGAVLLWEGRRRAALWFLLPAIPLLAWVAYVRSRTGNALGDEYFATYNLQYLLHPVRAAVAFVRRMYHLLFENFHWLGALSVLAAVWYANPFRTRGWAVAGLLTAAHVAAFSVFGGAILERYLLPVLPLVLIAIAAALSALPSLVSAAGSAALTAGLVLSHFWNPPYPFPYENNLAMVDFVELQQTAAHYLEQNYANARIATAWPMSEALRNKDLGYVSFGHPVIRLADFSPHSLDRVPRGAADVFVVFSREWNPPHNLLRIPAVEKFWRRFFGYQGQVSAGLIEARLGMKQVQMWSQRGQWIIILAARQPRPPLHLPY